MVEETLSGTVPHGISHPRQKRNTPASVDQKTAARKAADTRTAAKPVGRQQRLMIHLLIGFSMAATAVFGYALFGPGTNASAANNASHRLVDVSANTSGIDLQMTGGMQGMERNTLSGDMTTLHAEMEAITQRLNAIQAENVSHNIPSGFGSNPPSGVTGNGNSGPDNRFAGNSTDPTLATLNQMMATVHGMMAKIDQASSQSGGSGSHSGGAGHH